jgi:hypothetical protein
MSMRETEQILMRILGERADVDRYEEEQMPA